MEDQMQAAVLFADVSGSTKLYDQAGDTVAHAAIEACVAMFKRVTLGNGGTVIKTIGDEIMATFPSADQAAKSAMAMQTEITAMPEPVTGVQLGARIGFHFGSVVLRDGDVFGDTVNLAARLTDLASKGQIITDDETVKLLAPLLRADCRRLYSIPVKGKANEVHLVEMVWQESEDATQVARTRSVTARQSGKLTLRHGEQVLTLPGAKNAISLGREASTDMVVADRMASRIHCEIELRMDKFVLSDRSANGTYLYVDGQGEIVLRREEAILRGRGVITLGQTHETATERVEFSVE